MLCIIDPHMNSLLVIVMGKPEEEHSIDTMEIQASILIKK